MGECQARAKFGPWVDMMDRVMTTGERAYVNAVWHHMPGHTSFYDAFMRILHGKV